MKHFISPKCVLFTVSFLTAGLTAGILSAQAPGTPGAPGPTVPGQPGPTNPGQPGQPTPGQPMQPNNPNTNKGKSTNDKNKGTAGKNTTS